MWARALSLNSIWGEFACIISLHKGNSLVECLQSIWVCDNALRSKDLSKVIYICLLNLAVIRAPADSGCQPELPRQPPQAPTDIPPTRQHAGKLLRL